MNFLKFFDKIFSQKLNTAENASESIDQSIT